MKFAIHSPRSSYYYGGTERYVLNMTLNLSLLGKDVTLITYDSPKETRWFKEFKKKFKGEIITINSREIDKNFKKFENAASPKLWDKESLFFMKQTKKFYRSNNFDVIIFHYAVDCLGATKNSKIFLHLHGLPDKKRKIESDALKIPNKIIAVSKYVGDGWKKLHNINKKIYIVYNGIDITQKFPKRKKENDVLFFGRLIKIKGVDVLIKAISFLLPEYKEIKVKIIGEGPEKNELINLSKKLELKKNISFFGRVSDSVLKENIVKSKICIFPSYKREGVMTTLLEASLAKSCILASNSCSTFEYIKNNFNGLLFKPKDPKDLAKKIEILLSDKDLRLKLGNNAYKTVKNFAWKKQAKRLIRIYKSLN